MSAELAEIGYVIKTHGVRGHLKIAFDMQCKELTQGDALYFLSHGHHLPHFIQEIEYLEDGSALVLLEDRQSKEDAALLAKKAVFGPEEWIVADPEEENGLSDLIGYMVEDVQYGLLGPVTDVIDMQEYVLLEVVFEEKEILLPMHTETLVEMDDQKKTMLLRLPEGLIEL
ncbi:MAG: ribosome maturation factor RimM [Chitinophagales bacterium]